MSKILNNGNSSGEEKTANRVSANPLASAGANVLNKIHQLTDDIKKAFGFNPLTAIQRRRMRGTGIRKWGFIEKTMEIAATNMQYAPGTFNTQRINELSGFVKDLRPIIVALKQAEDAATDNLIAYSHELYTFALQYYVTVRDLARHGDQGAQEVFNVLKDFFRRSRMAEDGELTEPETVRKVKALMEGKASGRIVVEGKEKHVVGGGHAVVDETFKQHGSFKETVEGAICAECGARNAAGAKFCNVCGKEV